MNRKRFLIAAIPFLLTFLFHLWALLNGGLIWQYALILDLVLLVTAYFISHENKKFRILGLILISMVCIVESAMIKNYLDSLGDGLDYIYHGWMNYLPSSLLFAYYLVLYISFSKKIN